MRPCALPRRGVSRVFPQDALFPDTSTGSFCSTSTSKKVSSVLPQVLVLGHFCSICPNSPNRGILPVSGVFQRSNRVVISDPRLNEKCTL